MTEEDALAFGAYWIEATPDQKFGRALLEIVRQTNAVPEQQKRVAQLMREWDADAQKPYKDLLANLMGGDLLKREFSIKEQVLWLAYELEPKEESGKDGDSKPISSDARKLLVAQRHHVSVSVVSAAITKMRKVGYEVL